MPPCRKIFDAEVQVLVASQHSLVDAPCRDGRPTVGRRKYGHRAPSRHASDGCSVVIEEQVGEDAGTDNINVTSDTFARAPPRHMVADVDHRHRCRLALVPSDARPRHVALLVASTPYLVNEVLRLKKARALSKRHIHRSQHSVEHEERGAKVSHRF